MDFRFRILFYHENQSWVPQGLAMIDVPMFIPIVTDSAEVFENHLTGEGTIDLVLTGMNAKHLLLSIDHNNSLAFKKAPIWEVLNKHRQQCPIILLCTRPDIAKGIDIVCQGHITNFCPIGQGVDPNHLHVVMMKALEEGMLKELVKRHTPSNTHLPKGLFESIEALQLLRKEPPAIEPIQEALPETPLEDHFTVPESIPSDFPAFPHFPTGFHQAKADKDKSNEPKLPNLPTLPTLALNPAEQTELVNALERQGRIEDAPPSNQWTRIKKSPYDILLVVPDDETSHTISSILQPEGIKILTVRDSEEALTELNKALFNLMMVGIELPGHDGLELLRRIRLKGPQSNIDIIMIAEQGFENQVLTSMQYGANYFVVKPIQADKLRAQVVSMLHRVSS